MKINLYAYRIHRLSQVLSKLCHKILSQQNRILIWHSKKTYLEDLSTQLWSYGDFIPHGLWTQDYVTRQPVLLTTETNNVNQATCLIIVDNEDYNFYPWQDKLDDWHIICDVFSMLQDKNILKNRHNYYQNLVMSNKDAILTNYTQNLDTGLWHKQ